MRRTWLLAAAALVAAGLLGQKPAAAYPQWQFSSGVNRCNVCHFSPAGGGLLNGHGRDAAGEDLSTWAGEGAFLHGLVKMPAWLALGGDLRGAYAAQDVGDIDGARHALFPMQADLQARATPVEGLSFYGSLGLRAQVRPNEDLVPLQNYQPISTSRLISREHWLMYQQPGESWYVRAGRFYAPYGLRLAEHLTYVRRDLGFDQLRESYNLSGGVVLDDWELHLTAFAPDFLRHIGSEEYGGAAYYERRLSQQGSVAVQARYAGGPGIDRLMGGVVGRQWVPLAQTLFFAELDLVNLMPDHVSSSQQLVGAVGAALLPARGWMLTGLFERNQEDVHVRNAAWNAVTALLSWFPAPHAELQLVGRLQLPDGSAVAKTILLQGHYFL